jgi:probable F420-dependent oxidoreductase
VKFWASTAFSPPDHYLPLAQAADEAGVHGIVMSDHIFYPRDLSSPYPYSADGTPIWPPETAWPDNWVTIGAMAAVTERLRFGTSVYIAPARDLFTVAKQVGTAAVLSGNRVNLGVGAGWMREEFATLGLDPAERGARTDEYIQVLRTLWTQDPANFNGRFVDFDGVVLATKPRTEGGPPIWVGGNNDAGLRRALRHGYGWHGFEVYPDEIPDLRVRLERLGAEVGRDPGELVLSVARGLIPPGREEESFIPDRRMLGGSASAIVEELGSYAEQGVGLVLIQVSLLAPLVPEALEWVAAEVLPQLPRGR